MSSANSRVSKFDAFGRSLTCMENNNGPKVEPCGTPHAVLFCSEKTLLKLTEQKFISLLITNDTRNILSLSQKSEFATGSCEGTSGLRVEQQPRRLLVTASKTTASNSRVEQQQPNNLFSIGQIVIN